MSRIAAMWETRSRTNSMCPISMVALAFSPSSWATRMTRSQSSPVHLPMPIRRRTRGSKISPPPPGIVSSPAAWNRRMISRTSIPKNRSNSTNSGGENAWM